MERAAQSPDLNPIELLWEQLDRMVHKKCPSSQSNLWEELQEAWGEIPSDYLNKLPARMPKVCNAVIAANGAFFDKSKVWRTKLLFQIKIIISNFVNVLTIFSIHFATQLINKSVSFHGNLGDPKLLNGSVFAPIWTPESRNECDLYNYYSFSPTENTLMTCVTSQKLAHAQGPRSFCLPVCCSLRLLTFNWAACADFIKSSAPLVHTLFLADSKGQYTPQIFSSTYGSTSFTI